MAAIDFPNSPTDGDYYTDGFTTWQYSAAPAPGTWTVQREGVSGLNPDTVGNLQMQDNAIDTAEIVDGAVKNPKISWSPKVSEGTPVVGTASAQIFATLADVAPGLYHVVGHVGHDSSDDVTELTFDITGGAGAVFAAGFAGGIAAYSCSAVVSISATSDIRLRGIANTGAVVSGSISSLGTVS